MRTFLAVDLSDKVRKELGRFCLALANGAKRQGSHRPLRWTTTANLHVTLHFLGENLRAEHLPVLDEALRRHLAGIKRFNIALQGFGGFPDERRPRIYWVGIGTGVEELHALSDRAAAALDEVGVAHDARRFQPHVTICRASDAREQRMRGEPPPMPTELLNLSHWVQGIGARDLKIGDSFPVQALTLYESVLKPEGPHYQVLNRITL
ncbi:MAG: RNA 2',3'-cyclic phosphodiesterase [Planctomycetota bacterium]